MSFLLNLLGEAWHGIGAESVQASRPIDFCQRMC